MIEKRIEKEIEVLKRLGMRWAVLTSLYRVVSQKRSDLPSSVLKELKTARSMIESGFYRVCDVNCALGKIESTLFQRLASSSKGFESSDHWSNLLVKAMRGQLKPEEIRGMPFIKPLIQNCELLKYTCGTHID